MKPRLVYLETYKQGERGRLTTITPGEGSIVPFDVKRVFYIYDAPLKTVRGGHGHKSCEQFLIAVAGMVLIKLSDDEEHMLNSPEFGLYVPVGNFLRMIFMTPDACLLVLASEPYSKADYIYEKETE